MLFAAARAIGTQFLLIMALLLLSSGLVWLDGRTEAVEALLRTAITGLWAPVVWTFGYGLAEFVRRAGRTLPAMLDGILEPDEAAQEVAARLDRATRHRNAVPYTATITALGIILTLLYRVPVDGLAKGLVFIGICAIYYIAAYLLFHFMTVIQAFHCLFERMSEVKFRRIYNPMHLENLTTYLAITTGLGIIAIYAGFRGTLTADFQFASDVWRPFLLTPLVLFLPGTLFYNYYPRYVLRSLVQHKVFETMQHLGATGVDSENARALVLEMKETAALSSQILPFVDYKSLPSYLLAVAFAVSVVVQADPAVRAFLAQVLGL